MCRCSIATFSRMAGTTSRSPGLLEQFACRQHRAARSCSHETKRIRAMGLFTRDIKTMNDLFVHQLQDIYYAEKQLVKALPKMAEKAADQQLKQGFLTH